ncbi:MAG: SRPBCC family protein [Chloroflexota bacterium]
MNAEGSSGPDSIRQVDSVRSALLVAAEYPALSPGRMFDLWTAPHLLVTWWPDEADTERHEGGHYHLAWPNMDWHLRGVYTVFQPATCLQFTWHWDHEPQAVIETVTVQIDRRSEGGTLLRLRHEPYDDSDESQSSREGHLEGWMHFLSRLQAVE